MPKGEYYYMRLGRPESVSDLRSEWYNWFLMEIDAYDAKRESFALWALGGAGFVLKTLEATIYIDPYCGPSLRSEGLVLYRMIPLPFNPSDVKKIDALIMTHEDPDHLDENFVFPVSKNNSQCLFVGTQSVAELLESWKIPKERVVPLRNYDERRVKDVKIIALPSNDPYAKEANTYVFEIGNFRVFHSGDSFVFDEIAEIGRRYPVDVALINLGRNTAAGKWYNTPAEVVQIAQDLRAKTIIPMHWDIWSVSVENPYLVEEEVKRRKLDAKVKVLHIGSRFNYP